MQIYFDIYIYIYMMAVYGGSSIWLNAHNYNEWI